MCHKQLLTDYFCHPLAPAEKGDRGAQGSPTAAKVTPLISRGPSSEQRFSDGRSAAQTDTACWAYENSTGHRGSESNEAIRYEERSSDWRGSSVLNDVLMCTHASMEIWERSKVYYI